MNTLPEKQFLTLEERIACLEADVQILKANIKPKPRATQNDLIRADPLTLDQIIAKLKPSYPWVDTEKAKADITGWILSNPHRQITKRFVARWFARIQRPLKIEGLNSWAPPVYSQVLAYAVAKKWSSGFAKHCYDLWVATHWTHFGKKIDSDEQWKAIMNTMEFKR